MQTTWDACTTFQIFQHGGNFYGYFSISSSYFFFIKNNDHIRGGPGRGFRDIGRLGKYLKGYGILLKKKIKLKNTCSAKLASAGVMRYEQMCPWQMVTED